MTDSDSGSPLPEPANDIGTLRRALPLPTVESSPSTDTPWKDDLLGRRHLAANLTDFVRPQRDPLVISLHGGWGSGKTFFLRRWVQQLQNDDFSTFYYNAWSDDYSATPLVSILTALEGAAAPGRTTSRTLRAAATSFLLSAPVNILKAQTGVDLAQLGLDPKSLIADDALFAGYNAHRSHQKALRQELTSFSKSLSGDSARPTICVIDELDRCRPTFAIELLETVKHVFDIPGLVFLLALNRSQLIHSIRSVYGQIDANGYLRRFFHVNLDLPHADTETYSKNLLQSFDLNHFFNRLSNISNTRVHQIDYQTLSSFLPRFWQLLRLPLRDIEYCVTALAVVARNLPERHFLFPFLLAPLLVLRLRDPDLYLRFASESVPAAEVVDRLHDWTTQPDPTELPFLANDFMEVALYATHLDPFRKADDDPVTQMRLLAEGEAVSHPETLSRRTSSDPARAKALLGRYTQLAEDYGRHGVALSRGSFRALLALLDLATPPSRS